MWPVPFRQPVPQGGEVIWTKVGDEARLAQPLDEEVAGSLVAVPGADRQFACAH
jgi:hypothetical protein